MSILIATNTPNEPPPAPIANDGFFPAIDVDVFKTHYNVRNPISDEHCRQVLVEAMQDTNRQLEGWQARQMHVGFSTLAEVPARHYQEQSEKVAYYFRAVFHRAKADILAQYRNYDTTAQGHDRAEAMESTIDDHRRQALEALAAVEDRPRATVELL